MFAEIKGELFLCRGDFDLSFQNSKSGKIIFSKYCYWINNMAMVKMSLLNKTAIR